MKGSEEKIEVIEILKQWIEERFDNRNIRRFYQVKGSDGNLYTIYYDQKSMDWFQINKE